jgi:hypothetical protein
MNAGEGMAWCRAIRIDEDGSPAEPLEIPVPKGKDVEDALDRLIAAPDEG